MGVSGSSRWLGRAVAAALFLVGCWCYCACAAPPQVRALSACPPWWGSIPNDMRVMWGQQNLFGTIPAGGITQYQTITAGMQTLTLRQATTNAVVFTRTFEFLADRSYTLWFVVKTDGQGGTAYEAGLFSENDQNLAANTARVSLAHLGCTIHPLLGGCGEDNAFLDMDILGPTSQTASFIATNEKQTKVVDPGTYNFEIRYAGDGAEIASVNSINIQAGDYWSVYFFDHLFLREGSADDPCVVVVPDYSHGSYATPGECEQGDDVVPQPTDVYTNDDNSTLENCDTGCAGGPDAVRGLENHPNISVCAGTFTGYTAGPSAQSLCARSWHVCSQTNPTDLLVLKQVTYNEAADTFDGCYTYDAADDFDTCRPCTGNIHEDDMAGMGRDCTNHQPDGYHPERGERDPSCIQSGRVDYCCTGYKQNRGCQFVPDYTSGVVCCANNAANPCFNGQCPNDCCGNGLCDRSSATCSCLPGFSGDDCCTDCSKLTCEECTRSDVCAFCVNTQECVDREATACFEFSTNCPTPGSSGDDALNGVPIGAVVGATIGGLLLTCLIVGAVLAAILYWKFSTGEYAVMWEDMLWKGTSESPLYAGDKSSGTSALYVDAM